MMYEYLKQLVQDGEGKFTVCRIAAETEEALGVKRDMYLADDWQTATEEEYTAQFAARENVEGAEDKALGEKAAADESKANEAGEEDAEVKEGDACTMEDGTEGVVVKDEEGNLVCAVKPEDAAA